MRKPIRQLPPQFPFPLNLRWVGPRHGVFVDAFAFDSAILGERIIAERGFDTDFASIPRGLWNIFPPDGEYAWAAFIHDALYWHQATKEEGGVPVTRRQADRVLLEGMEALGISWPTRRIIYRAVYFGGQKAWDKNQQDNPALAARNIFTPARQRSHFHKLGPRR